MSAYRKPLGAAHDEPRTARAAQLAPVSPWASERPPQAHEVPERNKRDAVQEVMRRTAYRDPRGAVNAVNAAYHLLALKGPGYVPSAEELAEKVLSTWGEAINQSPGTSPVRAR